MPRKIKGELIALGFVVICGIPRCQEHDRISAATLESARRAIAQVGWRFVGLGGDSGAWVCPTHGADLGKAARRLRVRRSYFGEQANP